MSMETDRLEAELNESRHRLNDTLSALGDKLSPGQMLDEVLGLAQGQAGDIAKKLGSQVKDNPLPALLIAAGVGMLFLNRGQASSTGASALSGDDWHHERRYRSIEEARWSNPRLPNETDDQYAERTHGIYAATLGLKQRADEAIHDFKARVSGAVDSAREAAENVRDRAKSLLSDAKHSVSEGAHRLGDAAKHQAQNLGERAAQARDGAQNFYADTPLAAGAIALAAGALIGSAAPLSRPERETLRGVADKATRVGADLAERGADYVKKQADGAVH